MRRSCMCHTLPIHLRCVAALHAHLESSPCCAKRGRRRPHTSMRTVLSTLLPHTRHRHNKRSTSGGRSRMARNLRWHQHLLGGATQTTLSGCRRVGIMPRNGGRRVTLVEPRSACVPLSKGKTTYGPISDPSFMLKKTSVANNFLLTRPLEIPLPRIPHRRSSEGRMRARCR